MRECVCRDLMINGGTNSSIAQLWNRPPLEGCSNLMSENDLVDAVGNGLAMSV